jgi:hypothetical protein
MPIDADCSCTLVASGLHFQYLLIHKFKNKSIRNYLDFESLLALKHGLFVVSKF